MNISAQPSDWENPIQLPEVTPPARVLVPFDGSHNAERALAWAAYVAQAGGQDLVVVVAYEQPTTMRGRGAQYVEEVREHLEREATGLASEATVLMQERGCRHARSSSAATSLGRSWTSPKASAADW